MNLKILNDNNNGNNARRLKTSNNIFYNVTLLEYVYIT